MKQLLFLIVALGSTMVGSAQTQLHPIPEALIYTELNAWAAHPQLKDSSDISSAAIEAFDLEFGNQGIEIPTFFLYPTLYQKGELWNADPRDSAYRASVEQSSIRMQASVFNALGPVWAPHYRQMHYKGYFPRRSDNQADIETAWETAYEDVHNAFQAFLEANTGPFIIAGHSQGTHHATRLLREVVGVDSTLKSRLLVAFLVGGKVSAEKLPNVPICEHPEDINCWVGWRSYKDRRAGKGRIPSSLAVNPITMLSVEGRTKKSAHLGALDWKLDRLEIGLRTRVIKGAIYVKGIVFPYNLFIRGRDLHRYDYNLFWFDIRNNLYRRRSSLVDFRAQ